MPPSLKFNMLPTILLSPTPSKRKCPSTFYPGNPPGEKIGEKSFPGRDMNLQFMEDLTSKTAFFGQWGPVNILPLAGGLIRSVVLEETFSEIKCFPLPRAPESRESLKEFRKSGSFRIVRYPG